MRVVECLYCDELIQAADDEDLVRRLNEHVSSEHSGTSMDEDEARRHVSDRAYSATDS